MYLALFILSFSLSIGLLRIFFSSHRVILTPLQKTMSSVLGSTSQKNTNGRTEEVKQALSKHALSSSSISVAEKTISVQLLDGTQVLLSTEKDVFSQIDSLQVTIDNLTIEGKRIFRVDMRFARPVVTFQ